MNDFIIPKEPLYVIDKILKSGYKAGLVGGCLRNLMLNLPIKDYDISTSASVQTIKNIFSENKILEHGIKYGTLTIIVDKKLIEVTTFRKESEYKDYRHPNKIEFIDDLKIDLSRRDFTINALYFNAKEGLIDYFHGTKDLKNKLIRCVGDCNIRFKEDPLRILRGLRFSSNLNFKIEEKTKESIFKNYHLLKNISKERIAMELVGIFKGDSYREILSEFYSIFKFLIPELKEEIPSLNFYKDLNLRLISFFVNLNGDTDKIIKDLKLSVSPYLNKNDISVISKILEYKDYKIIDNKIDHIKLWKKFNWDKKLYEMWSLLFNKEANLSLPEISFQDLNIKASDLIKHGLEQKRIGEVLNKLFLIVVTNNIPNNKEILIDIFSKNLL